MKVKEMEGLREIKLAKVSIANGPTPAFLHNIFAVLLHAHETNLLLTKLVSTQLKESSANMKRKQIVEQAIQAIIDLKAVDCSFSLFSICGPTLVNSLT